MTRTTVATMVWLAGVTGLAAGQQDSALQPGEGWLGIWNYRYVIQPPANAPTGAVVSQAVEMSGLLTLEMEGGALAGTMEGRGSSLRWRVNEVRVEGDRLTATATIVAGALPPRVTRNWDIQFREMTIQLTRAGKRFGGRWQAGVLGGRFEGNRP